MPREVKESKETIEDTGQQEIKKANDLATLKLELYNELFE